MTDEPTRSDADRRTFLLTQAAELSAKITPETGDRLLAYLDAMLDLNQRINLTGVRDPEQALILHVLDGLAFARTGLRPRHILDLGTGNGFPGVCVAALHPKATTLLMDKTGKKVRAVGTCLLTAGLNTIDTIQLDAAQAPKLQPDLRHAFDLITARAVARPEALAPLAAPLCRPGGHLTLWLEEDAETPPKLGRFRLQTELPYTLPAPANRQRKLATWQAT